MGSFVTLVVRFTAPRFCIQGFIMYRTRQIAKTSPGGRAPRLNLGTKTSQLNRGGILRVVNTRRDGREVHLTTPARKAVVQGDLNFAVARMGGHEELWCLCSRNDATRIFAHEGNKFRV